MGLYGWSNIIDEPVICVTVTTSPGEVHLIESIDASVHSHTTKYLVDIFNQAITKCKTQFNCFVDSIVTDSANNGCAPNLKEKSKTLLFMDAQHIF